MKILKNRKWRILLTIIIVIMLIAITGTMIYLIQVKNYQTRVENLTFSEIDLKNIPDGTYIGDCNVEFIYAKVEATILDGKITNINLLKHKNGHGAKAESITNEIVSQQKIDVEVITGATNSSKVIKKAVENALNQN